MTKQVINSKSLSALEITTVQQAWFMFAFAYCCHCVGGGIGFSNGSWWHILVKHLVFGYCLYLVCLLCSELRDKTQFSFSGFSSDGGSEPAFGALFAFIYLGETFSSWQLFGAVLVLTSTLCVAANIADKPLFIREKWLKQSWCYLSNEWWIFTTIFFTLICVSALQPGLWGSVGKRVRNRQCEE